jgi:hypothetical protein
MRTVYT